VAGGGTVHRHAADRIFRREVVFRCSLELCTAAVTAEVESTAAIIQRWLASIGIDGHAADGIADHHILNVGIMMMVMTVAMMAVIVLVVLCHVLLLCPKGRRKAL